jgi:hypothetical protein
MMYDNFPILLYVGRDCFYICPAPKKTYECRTDQRRVPNLNRIDKTEIYRWIDEEASVYPLFGSECQEIEQKRRVPTEKACIHTAFLRLKVVKVLFQAREAADNRGVGLPVVNRYIRHNVGNDSGGVMNVMQGPSARDFELQWIRRRWRHI